MDFNIDTGRRRLSLFDVEQRAKLLWKEEEDATEKRESLLSAIRAKEGLIGDRSYYFKTYPSCFVGKEAVSFAVAAGHAESRQEATELLQAAVGLARIHHVCGEHDFEDEELFYRFREDESDAGKERGVGLWRVGLGVKVYQADPWLWNEAGSFSFLFFSFLFFSFLFFSFLLFFDSLPLSLSLSLFLSMSSLSRSHQPSAPSLFAVKGLVKTSGWLMKASTWAFASTWRPIFAVLVTDGAEVCGEECRGPQLLCYKSEAA